MSEGALFDPDPLRALRRRAVFVRTVERPTLVLGSTQSADLVDRSALERRGVELLRRRSGGGAVLLQPGQAVWLDAWVPRGDPLFDDDVARSRSWVGSWWVSALGNPGLEVHRGSPVCTRCSDLICFAGIASGEVVHRGRKVVGVAQWRSREGALTHSLAYLRADWAAMVDLLGLGAGAAAALADVVGCTTTVTELGHRDESDLTSRLLSALPGATSWEVAGSLA